MVVQIRYFASIREALGLDKEEVTGQYQSLGHLRDELIARGGAYAEVLARNQAVRLALNQTIADESQCLPDVCEVAFFPPVTGG
jgi:molybdopterin synthase sulfur carrier subunit